MFFQGTNLYSKMKYRFAFEVNVFSKNCIFMALPQHLETRKRCFATKKDNQNFGRLFYDTIQGDKNNRPTKLPTRSTSDNYLSSLPKLR